ncbi:hypothetical protein BJ973_005073 [Actinoplanes tereljensis]|uniref:Uncharacterized protein n=1 Tax=Paractinoplanes tereljensis TaxID=571912 RepID=A0A919NNS0_9ACTN|nr:hypothetical protein [Actinoplanes tereljensis]GIF21480.1 hypothetical protein Ate02nite_42100 [Actinoplanes tereljensis]
MRTVVVRLVQAGLVVVLAFAGFHLVRDTQDAQKYHQAAMALSLGDDLVLGPNGIGKLTLGMSVADANATDQVRIPADLAADTTGKCHVYAADAADIHFARDHGLAVITAAPTVKTPEGIAAGATVAEVAKAYPKLNHADRGTPEQQEQATGYLAAPVPANPKANYVFVFHVGGGSGPKDAKVQVVLLALADQDNQCTEAG